MFQFDHSVLDMAVATSGNECIALFAKSLTAVLKEINAALHFASIGSPNSSQLFELENVELMPDIIRELESNGFRAWAEDDLLTISWAKSKAERTAYTLENMKRIAEATAELYKGLPF